MKYTWPEREKRLDEIRKKYPILTEIEIVRDVLHSFTSMHGNDERHEINFALLERLLESFNKEK